MRASLIQLHLAVFLWGFTGVLGRTIELNEGLLVWYRILLTVITLLVWLQFKGGATKIPRQTMLQLFGIGGIIALHWLFFYGSIKYSNVSIALTCLSSAGLFTALLNPFFSKQKIVLAEVGLGIIGIIGIYLIFHFDPHYKIGIVTGIIAALLSVVFSFFNKKLVATTTPDAMMLYEMAGGLVLLTVCMPAYLHFLPTNKLLPTPKDWVWLLVLTWICTIWAMKLSLKALKKISPFTQNLTLNLEPVYGIILAFIIYKENKQLSNGFYLGFAFILLAVVLQTFRVVKLKKH